MVVYYLYNNSSTNFDGSNDKQHYRIVSLEQLTQNSVSINETVFPGTMLFPHPCPRNRESEKNNYSHFSPSLLFLFLRNKLNCPPKHIKANLNTD